MDGAVGWAVELLAFVWLRRGYLHTVVPLLDVEGFSAPKTTKIKQFKKNVLMDVLKTLSYNIKFLDGDFRPFSYLITKVGIQNK